MGPEWFRTLLGLPFTYLFPILLLPVFTMHGFASATTAEGTLRLVVTRQNPAPHVGPNNSYGLAIANLMDYPIAIHMEILIEKQTTSGWKQQGVIQAINSCDSFDHKWSSNKPVRLDPHATMTVVPSNGWICGEQCPTACQQNVPHMPGIYRFVVVTVPDGQRIASPQFSIEWLQMYVQERTDFHHTFTGMAKSYSLMIDNMSNRDISIKRGISIWKKMPTGWSLQLGSLQAISKCDEFDHDYRLETPIHIPSFGTITAVPWNGFMCGGQCPTACMKDYPLGPGTFRFEIVVMPDATKLQSPAFTIQ